VSLVEFVLGGLATAVLSLVLLWVLAQRFGPD
jgi:hypothetical protein